MEGERGAADVDRVVAIGAAAGNVDVLKEHEIPGHRSADCDRELNAGGVSRQRQVVGSDARRSSHAGFTDLHAERVHGDDERVANLRCGLGRSDEARVLPVDLDRVCARLGVVDSDRIDLRNRSDTPTHGDLFRLRVLRKDDGRHSVDRIRRSEPVVEKL